MADLTQKQMASAALWRAARVAIAMALPVLISYLAGQPNNKLALLGPVINALAKYARDAWGMDWLPV